MAQHYLISIKQAKNYNNTTTSIKISTTSPESKEF